MYGLVVTEQSASDSNISHAVYVDCKCPLIFIRRPEEPDWHKMSKENRKAHDKMLRGKQLNFGDWIKFDEIAMKLGFIPDYSKEYELCPSRITADHTQVEAVCVFSPGRIRETPMCFSDLFGLVTATREQAGFFLPDVALRCWISVEVRDTEFARFSFGAFAGVAEDQSAVMSTPWNRDGQRFVVRIDEDEELNKDNWQEAEMPWELNNTLGIWTGGNTVLCPQYRNIRFHLAYTKAERGAVPGDWIVFDATYSGLLHAFVVGSYRRKVDRESLVSKLTNFNTLTVLEMRVKSVAMPFGYLRAPEADFGLVHDPKGMLIPALLNGSKDTVFEVYVADMGPSLFSRFSVHDVSERTARLVRNCSELGYEPLEDLEGVLIGGDQVVVRDYAVLIMHFDANSTPGWQDVPVGTWIKFTALPISNERGKPVLNIREWTRCFKRAADTVECELVNGERRLQTVCHYREDLGVLVSSAFGVVDDPYRTCGKLQPGTAYTVWIMRGSTNHRTPFIICSSDDQPAETAAAPETTTEGVPERANEGAELEAFEWNCYDPECAARSVMKDMFETEGVLEIVVETFDFLNLRANRCVMEALAKFGMN